MKNGRGCKGRQSRERLFKECKEGKWEIHTLRGTSLRTGTEIERKRKWYLQEQELISGKPRPDTPIRDALLAFVRDAGLKYMYRTFPFSSISSLSFLFSVATALSLLCIGALGCAVGPLAGGEILDSG